jgi:molecular chaperone GrpE
MNEELRSAGPDQGPPETMEEVEAESSETEETLQEQCSQLLAQKEEEIKQLQDRVLRLAAETENTRKRLERERSDGICFANESLIRELLPVVDNLERAIQHSEQQSDFESLLEGVRMTLKGFSDILSKFGCAPFVAMGEPFDPRFHEAMMQQEAEGRENTVLQEFQKGYKLHDRLLRPALVIVSKSSRKEPVEE